MIATAEQASTDSMIPDGEGEHVVERKHAWRRMAKAVTKRCDARIRVSSTTASSVALLMFSEASRRAQKSPTTTHSAEDHSEAIALFLERYLGSNEDVFRPR